jgi:hypothetical protein
LIRPLAENQTPQVAHGLTERVFQTVRCSHVGKLAHSGGNTANKSHRSALNVHLLRTVRSSFEGIRYFSTPVSRQGKKGPSFGHGNLATIAETGK